jgi:hypothetical protein
MWLLHLYCPKVTTRDLQAFVQDGHNITMVNTGSSYTHLGEGEGNTGKHAIQGHVAIAEHGRAKGFQGERYMRGHVL